MHKAIQYSFIFLMLVILVSTAMGDAFDQTVNQIKILETELEQNRETALQEIKTQVAAERETNPLGAPKDQFDSDVDYQARLNELEGVLSKIHTDIWGRYLEDNKTRKTEVGRLYNRIFEVNNLTVTLGTYDANSEYFPITVEMPLNGENQQHEGSLHIGKDDARDLFNNWDQVIKTGYISIGIGYRRNLVGLKLEIPNLSKGFYYKNYNPPGENVRFSRPSYIISETSPYRAREFSTGIDSPHAVSISPNGKYIAVSDDGNLRLWEISNVRELWQKNLSWVRRRGVAFSPNDEFLVVNSADNKGPCVILFKTLSGHEVTRWHIPPATGKTQSGEKKSYPAYTTHNVAFSPNGQYIAIAAEYSIKPFVHSVFLWLWDLNNNRRRGWYIHDQHSANFVTFSPNGEFLALATDGEVIIYGVNAWWTDRKIHQVLKLDGQGRSIAFSPNGKYLAASGSNRNVVGVRFDYVTFWDVSSGGKLLQTKGYDNQISALSFSPNGEYLAVGYKNGVVNIELIGTEEITPKTEITFNHGVFAVGYTVHNLAWGPYGNYISTGKTVHQILEHPEVHNLDSEFAIEPPQQTTDTDENEVVVRLTPATLESPPIGAQLSLNIGIVGAQNIAGYQATVQFDTTALQYVESSNGDYLPEGAFFLSPVSEGNTVTLASTAFSGESSRDGTLATITFEVVSVKASTVSLSNVLLTDSTSGSHKPITEAAEITQPELLLEDVNQDGVVNIIDLTTVASNFGKQGENVADVNGDGVVNIIDLTMVAAAFGNTASAPVVWDSDLSVAPTRTEVAAWLQEARQINLTNPTFQRGILVLEQFLAALTPKETTLLPNYPNPFNPETWIPYQLAAPADVNISIYAADGRLVRRLDLGHRSVGMYESRSRAAYWDGRNAQGEPVASGVYFYTLTAGDFSATRKMSIMK